MKTLRSIIAFALFTSFAHAADEEFRQLFDGRSFTGWAPTPGGKWEINDGVIVGNSAKSVRRDGCQTISLATFDLKWVEGN